MSSIICSNCGTTQKTEYKYCVVCGRNFSEELQSVAYPKSPTTTPVKHNTFFCPS